MTTETLQLRYTSRRQRDAAAWFLPGSSPTEWLREIATWNVSMVSLRLLIVPTSLENRSPLGVLVKHVEKPLQVSPSRAYPYGCLAGRLYLPCEANLEPAVHESELKQLLANGRDYVWHPQVGLIGFDPEEIRTIADLITARIPEPDRWNNAETGPGYAHRLGVIESIAPLSLEKIFQSGRDDIGTQSESLDELPPLGDETPDPGPIGKALSGPKRAMAKLTQWLTDKSPATADGETWVNRLQNWANRVLSSEILSAREKELNRLLNMLKNNPDEGLKYALPMSGNAARGIAPPSTRLTSRDVNFRMGSRGGGPADPWAVPPETHMRLVAEYRQLAAREMKLGRYRRAAYIYSELLGDDESAVGALKAGGYFREAAVVCKEKLNRLDKAAQCLEEGGLWNEALKEYVTLKNHEKCGEICRRLGKEDSALKFYQIAAWNYVNQNNFLKAAKLHDEKCGDPMTARSTLQRGWEHPGQAADCLREELRLLGRDGLHHEAKTRVKSLAEKDDGKAVTLRLSEVLGASAKTYPDENYRVFAADQTRIVVSRQLVRSLDDHPGADDRKLLQVLEQLASSDRLLHRDCERYFREWSTAQKPKTYPLANRGVTFKCVRRIELAPDIVWQKAVATNRFIYAVGHREHEVGLMRLERDRLDDPPHLIPWESARSPGVTFVAPSPNDSRGTWIRSIPGEPLPTRKFLHPPVLVETPGWCHSWVIGMAQTHNGYSWVVSDKNGLSLSVYSSAEIPVISRSLPFPESEWNKRSYLSEIPMHARSDGIFLGLGEQVLWMSHSLEERVFAVPNEIVSLSGSASHARVRIAVSFSSGGAVIWKDTGKIQRFGHGLITPKTAMTQTGKLVAADDSKIEIYDTSNGDVTFQCSRDSQGVPISVVAFPPNNFAILHADGRLNVYQIHE